MSSPRVVAIIAAYNEERFIGSCLEHLFRQGVEAYVADNDSTDATFEIASRYLGRGLRGIERIPRDGTFRWKDILRRKEEIATELDADWFIHLDADEFPLAPRGFDTLADGLAAADARGDNAMPFASFIFVPTREQPDHDHPDFLRTMLWYYPFTNTHHVIRAWRRQPTRVDLASAGGHEVRFPGRRVSSDLFRLRHYLFLSRDHARRKYVQKTFAPEEVSEGWHGWRASVRVDEVPLPASSQLREARVDEDLDHSDPRTRHWLYWAGE